MKYFLCVIGMAMILEGLPYFIAPKKMKNLIWKVLQSREDFIRQLGLSMMILGLIFIYLGKC